MVGSNFACCAVLSAIPVLAAELPQAIVVPCALSAPSLLNVGSSGGSGIVSVGLSGCYGYSIQSDSEWAELRVIVAGPQATARWTVQPNPSPTVRIARVTLVGNMASRVMTVHQAGACPATIGETQGTVPYTGGSMVVTAAPTSNTCPCTAASNVGWAQPYPVSLSSVTTMTVNLFPNFSSRQRAATVTIGDRTLTILQGANPRTFNERSVQLFYFGAFGRLPSEEELAFQVAAIQAGLSRELLFLNFYASEEFRLGGSYVGGAYLGLLGRRPEYNGWLFQRNALATHLITDVQLVENFLSSAEFASIYGNPTPAELVRALYWTILSRDASDAEIAFQVAHMGTATIRERALFARSLLLSPEFVMSRDRTLADFLLTATLLGRESGMGDTLIVGSMFAGQPTFVVGLMMGCTEFQSALQ